MPEGKSIWQKLGDAATATWKFLDGSKRRIALLSGLVMHIAKPYTVAYTVAEACFYLFGSADVLQSSSQQVKKRLPSGLSKDDK